MITSNKHKRIRNLFIYNFGYKTFNIHIRYGCANCSTREQNLHLCIFCCCFLKYNIPISIYSNLSIKTGNPWKMSRMYRGSYSNELWITQINFVCTQAFSSTSNRYNPLLKNKFFILARSKEDF